MPDLKKKSDSEIFNILYNVAIQLLQASDYIRLPYLFKFNNDEDTENVLMLMFANQAALAAKINMKELPMEMVYYSLCKNALYVGMYVEDYLNSNNLKKLNLTPEEIDEFIFTVHKVNAEKMGMFIDGEDDFKFDIPTKEFAVMLEESPYFDFNVKRIIEIMTNALKVEAGSSATEDKYMMMMLSLFLRIGVTLYHSIFNWWENMQNEE